ncbi:MAG: hypothetical protein V4622_02805 [Bacteroidota bacterium]
MSKKRAIVSYDKLSIDQKKLLLLAFPDGFSEGMTQIKTPTGETLDALLWETEEIIYLVKINKPTLKAKSVDDEDDDFDEDDDLVKADEVKVDDEDEFADDDVEDEYDVADKDDGEEDDVE